jgi:hypothetical protein
MTASIVHGVHQWLHIPLPGPTSTHNATTNTTTAHPRPRLAPTLHVLNATTTTTTDDNNDDDDHHVTLTFELAYPLTSDNFR